jgi:hypothetical protein
MLELVVSLQEQGLPEDRLVTEARALIQNGRVVLTGNFAGCLASTEPPISARSPGRLEGGTVEPRRR